MITARDFNVALALLSWDNHTAARRLGLKYNTVSQYKTGNRKVPMPVERLLKAELKNKDNFKKQSPPHICIKFLLN